MNSCTVSVAQILEMQEKRLQAIPHEVLNFNLHARSCSGSYCNFDWFNFLVWFSKYSTKQIECSGACFQAHKGKLHVSIPYGFLVSNKCKQINFFTLLFIWYFIFINLIDLVWHIEKQFDFNSLLFQSMIMNTREMRIKNEL